MPAGRPKKILNDAKSKVIEENLFKENPEGLPDGTGIIVAKNDKIPEYRKVIFLNGRDPGCALQFHYHSATHYLKQYTLFHGYEHELPVEVIEHLESCNEPQYGYRKNQEGHPEPYIISRKYVFSFRNPARKVA